MSANMQLRPIKTVGFIGLGNMGFPMASQLVKAGFDIVVYDVDPSRCKLFAETIGGRIAEDLMQVGKLCDVVITMLPNSVIVREVIVGHSGIAEALEPFSLVLDMSTSSPEHTRKLGAELLDKKIHLVDAPVAGGVIFAQDGTLEVLTGGNSQAIEHVRQLLLAMGKNITYCGSLGTAHTLKAINNYINAAVMCVYLEGMIIGRSAGINLSILIPAIEAATLDRNHPFGKKIKNQILNRKFATGMAMGLIAKDLKVAVDAAGDLDAEAPIAALVQNIWQTAADNYGFDRDQSEIVRYWEDAAQLELKF